MQTLKRVLGSDSCLVARNEVSFVDTHSAERRCQLETCARPVIDAEVAHRHVFTHNGVHLTSGGWHFHEECFYQRELLQAPLTPAHGYIFAKAVYLHHAAQPTTVRMEDMLAFPSLSSKLLGHTHCGWNQCKRPLLEQDSTFVLVRQPKAGDLMLHRTSVHQPCLRAMLIQHAKPVVQEEEAIAQEPIGVVYTEQTIQMAKTYHRSACGKHSIVEATPRWPAQCHRCGGPIEALQPHRVQFRVSAGGKLARLCNGHLHNECYDALVK
jgi:hypothetical protein